MIPFFKKSWPVVLGAACLCVTGCSTPGGVSDLLPGDAGRVSLDGPMSQGDIREVNFSIARALEQQGQLQQAAEFYERILEQDPDRVEVVHRLAITHDKLGKREHAQELFREALAVNPNDADLLADQGYGLYLAGKFDEAETVLRKAVEIDPKNERAQVNLGLVLCGSSRFDEAEQVFSHAGLSDEEARMNLAFGLSVSGRLEEARETYAGLHAEEPSSEELARRIGQIDHLLAMTDGAASVAAAEEPRTMQSEADPAAAIESRGTARVSSESTPVVPDDASRVSLAGHRQDASNISSVFRTSGVDEESSP